MKKRGLSKKLNINSILLQDPSKIKNYTYLTTNVMEDKLKKANLYYSPKR